MLRQRSDNRYLWGRGANTHIRPVLLLQHGISCTPGHLNVCKNGSCKGAVSEWKGGLWLSNCLLVNLLRKRAAKSGRCSWGHARQEHNVHESTSARQCHMDLGKQTSHVIPYTCFGRPSKATMHIAMSQTAAPMLEQGGRTERESIDVHHAKRKSLAGKKLKGQFSKVQEVQLRLLLDQDLAGNRFARAWGVVWAGNMAQGQAMPHVASASDAA